MPQKMQSNFSKMGTAVKAALGVAAVGIIGRFIAANVKLASSVEEMQSKSSVVFGQFVGDVRKDLEEFGNAVGRSTFELEGMASSVQDTFVPLGFARGEAADLSVALTKLAVDVASFNNASDTETMQAFQSALVGNHEAVRRFGIVITEAELKAELFRMGITKNANEVDAATKVQARLNLIMAGTTDAQGDAERTADSFANRSKALSAALDELAVKVLTPLLPILADFVGGLTSAINSVNEFLTASGLLSQDLSDQSVVVELLTQKLSELGIAEDSLEGKSGRNKKSVTDRIKALKEEILTLEAHFDANEKRAAQMAKVNEIAKKAEGPSKEEVERTKKITEAINELSKSNELLALGKANLTEAERAYQELLIELGPLTEEQSTKLKTLTSEAAALNKAFEDAAKANAKFNEKVQQGTTIAKGFESSQTELEEKLEKVKFAMRTAAEEDLPMFENAIKEIDLEIKRLDPSFQRMEAAVNTFADGMSNALADAFLDGKLSMESLRDVFRSVVKQMIAEAIRAQIVRQLMNFSMGFFGGGGAVGGSSSSGTFGASDSFAGGGRIPARASGGPVMVGERGPELFIPNSSGVIRNNHDTLNMMAGATKEPVVNQTINVTTGVATTVRAEILSMMPRIKSETISAMIDGKKRGNVVGKVF